jgi:hypothetical protein
LRFQEKKLPKYLERIPKSTTFAVYY